MYLQVLGIALAALEVVVASPMANRRRQPQHRLERRDDYLTSTGLAKLQSIGLGSSGVPASGINADSPTQPVWIGSSGDYVVNYLNNSPGEVVLVVWGSSPPGEASFVKAVQPLITISLEGAGQSGNTATLSFETDQSGAWAGVYNDTVLSQYGQIQNTWGEWTMSPSGVVDVSREVYTEGNTLSIAGPDCTSNMDTCVYECIDPSVTTCGTSGSYQLVNCATGSQPGANIGPAGASGGCGWEGATAVTFQATFS